MEGKTVGRREVLRGMGAGVASLALRPSPTATAQGARRPNVLFFYPDQLRHDYVEPSSDVPVRTPHLARLSAQGVRFTRAVTPSPLCAPARACVASGREYDRCGVASNAVNYPPGQKTMYSMLRDSGYHVMGCGKFDLHKPELDWGVDGRRLIREWGFSDGIDNGGKHDGVNAFERRGKPMGPYLAYLDRLGLAQAHVEDFRKRKGHAATFPTPLPDEAYVDNWIGRNGLELLGRAPRGRPWFLQVNFNGPHAPWDITSGMENGWRSARFPPANGGRELTSEQYNAVRQNYAAMIENIDRWLGVYVEKLRERGELANTLIVFSSDHGEMLGDHDTWAKNKPYQPSVGVPLAVWGPGVRRGVVCDTPSTTLDVTATVLDYAGIAVPRDADSRSLRPYLEGRRYKEREYVLSGLGAWRMVIRDRYKYVAGFGDGPMLFDMVNDPLENENLAAKMPGIAEDLGRLIPKG